MCCRRALRKQFSQQGWLLRGRACSGADLGVRERGQVLRSGQCQGRPRPCGRKRSPHPPCTTGICPGGQSPALGRCDKHLGLLGC